MPESLLRASAERIANVHRPVLVTCASEPYPPTRIGYAIAKLPAASPSSDFTLTPIGAMVVEYAIWFDWDIGHLYDLEHVWVHLDDLGNVVRVEGSQHGRRVDMAGCVVDNGRPVLYLEPGKHAVWPSPAAMATERSRIIADCQALAGRDGIHVDNPFGARGLIVAGRLDHRLARLKLKRDAFRPAFDFRRTDAAAARLVPWTELCSYIPRRVADLIARNRVEVPHLAAVFLDCGDTLVDEGTEIKDEATEIVSAAALIPGAENVLTRLRQRGYRLALVADGPRETFVNVLGAHGMWDDFDAHVISGDVGAHKPDARMFRTAIDALGLTPAAAARIAMVGNNLERDIKGANALGLVSVFMSWSTRRSHSPRDASEKPAFTIGYIEDLPECLETIELALPATAAQTS